MRQLAVTKCRRHGEMWEMLAGLIVWPWQEPVFELTVYGNYPECFLFFFWSVLWWVRAQTKHWQRLIWKYKAYAFCLYHRVLTCLSLPSLTPCSFLNEIDPVCNDSFHSSSCFGVAPKKNYTTQMYAILHFPSIFFCSWQGRVGGKPQAPCVLY